MEEILKLIRKVRLTRNDPRIYTPDFRDGYMKSLDELTKQIKNHSDLSNVSVSDLIIERRQYILDKIWFCKETDLTDDEVDTLDEKMDRDMSVVQWLHSR